MSPTSEEAYNFITKFKNVLDLLGETVEFQPKYKFKNLSQKMTESFLEENCYAHGSYCVAEKEIFEAKSVLLEGVRQICVWNMSKDNTLNADLWWNYIFHYRNCLRSKIHSKSPTKRHCFDIIQEDLNLSSSVVSKIDKCIKDSFSNFENKFESDNTLLESNVNPYEYSDVYLVPAVFINGQMVKEDLNSQIVLSATCDVLTTRPEACRSLAINNIKWEHERQIFGDYKIIKMAILWGIILCFFTFVIWIIRSVITSNVHDEVNNEIRNHVTEYMKLNDNKSNQSFDSSVNLQS